MFWRKDYFRDLNDTVDTAASRAEWAAYGSYCAMQERGLRKEAFVHLERFLTAMENAPFQERKTFVSWLLTHAEGRTGRDILLPHPLQRRLIEPTLLEWTLVEPSCSEPHRWLGDREHLQRAVELDPKDELARIKLIRSMVSQVGFNTHELPRGYLGYAEEDLAVLKEAETLLEGVLKDGDRSVWSSEIAEDRKLIEDYLKRKTGSMD